MPHITFDHNQAHEALDQFLSGDDEGQSSDGRRIGRSIRTADGNDIAAEIVDPVYLSDLRDAADAWRDHMEPKGDTDLPAGYRPYQHAPTAREDRMLPTEPLQDPLARIFLGKPYTELDSDEQTKTLLAAISCLLRTTLDPDDTGAVPILMRAHDLENRDAPQSRMLWQLAYKTTVPGLFIRATANGFFGEEFGIVTGSGFQLASGWWDRDVAEKAVAAIGQALPQIDWMEVKNASVFTPDALAALKNVFARYRFTGEVEEQPAAEPVPADS